MDDLTTELETKFLDFKVESDRIRERCRTFLKQQIIETENAWRTAAIQVFDQNQMEILVCDGAASLKALFDDIINSGQTMTEDNARREFEKKWNEKIEYIHTKFDPDERLRQAVKYVYGYYSIFEKKNLPAPDTVINKIQIIHLLKDVFKSSCSQCSCRNGKNATQAQISNGVKKDDACEFCEHSFIIDHALQEDCRELMMKSREMLNKKVGDMKDSIVENLQLSFATTTIQNFEYICNTTTSQQLTFDFRKSIRDKITTELNQNPTNPSNVLHLNVFIERTYEKLRNLIEDRGKACPVEMDLIQRIISSINAQFESINRELVVFGLPLSLNTKSEIHTNILLILTVLFYLEQEKHFKQQLKTLATQKIPLLNYFLSLVVTDVSFDTTGGTTFVHQLLNSIKDILKTEATEIIEMNIAGEHGNLNRQQLQAICD
ncbi:unnamed protein product, partial [Rotaria sp. Silwood2]